MLKLSNIKNTFYTNVFNKYLATSYFVNKKYKNELIKESFLQMELANSFKNDFTNDTEVDVVDISNIKNIVINNYYSTPSSTSSSYKHTQSNSILVWNVIHNLGYLPSLPLITDLTGKNIDAIVYNIDTNNTTITFSQPQSGYAYFS